MRWIKNFLFGIIAFLALLVVVSFFLPQKFTVERSIEIDAPVERVFAQVNDIRNWDNWSYWHTIDPDWELKFTSVLSGEGAGYSWKSEDAQLGSGNLQIVESKAYEEVVVHLVFNDWEDESKAYYFFEENKEKTTATFSMDFNVGLNPFQKFGGLFIKNIMNNAFKHGLQHLKLTIEETTQ